MRVSFRDRDPLMMGIVGMSSVALLVFGAFNLTIFQGGTVYHAAFTEASGLKPNEEVRIAGVKVGKVRSVKLEGDHVRVAFSAGSHVRFGTQSQVRIKISTLLGAHYLEVQPRGDRRQSPHTEIPTSRTAPSYEVVPALQDLSGQLQKIDVPQLAKALDTLDQTLKYSPDNVRRTLSGLRKISHAISSRDDELSSLLGHTRSLTGLLADRSGDLAQLVSGGGLLLQELNDRRQVITSLLSGTVSLSNQITGAIEENRATLNPAMRQLHRVLDILRRNQGNIDKSLKTLGPFVTVSADATAQGRWFDGYLQNLIPLPVAIGPAQPPIDDHRSGSGKRAPSGTTTPGTGRG
ncbi:MCE family protein [Actinoallomurus purpureus]|uniref:MCE family protein n=1 Tax=Actinoallomurus purpureus TaxID=478114 RepID=UPI00209388F7|nr:MCE family protein [Actinoallomurus purpureus]MCO6004536.1 MCE family protein [Actinoallomurus purpureus]